MNLIPFFSPVSYFSPGILAGFLNIYHNDTDFFAVFFFLLCSTGLNKQHPTSGSFVFNCINKAFAPFPSPLPSLHSRSGHF